MFVVCGVYLVLVGLVGVSINSLVCLLFFKCKKVCSKLLPPEWSAHWQRSVLSFVIKTRLKANKISFNQWCCSTLFTPFLSCFISVNDELQHSPSQPHRHRGRRRLFIKNFCVTTILSLKRIVMWYIILERDLQKLMTNYYPPTTNYDNSWDLGVPQELVCLIGIPFTAGSAIIRDWEMSETVCNLAGFVMTTLGT